MARAFHRRRRGTRVARRGSRNRASGEPGNEKRLYLPLPAKKSGEKVVEKGELSPDVSRVSNPLREPLREHRLGRGSGERRRRRRISMRLFVRRGVPPRARRRRRHGRVAALRRQFEARAEKADAARADAARRTPRPSERIRRNRAVRRRATTTRARESSARDFLKKRHSRVRADSRRERHPAPKTTETPRPVSARRWLAPAAPRRRRARPSLRAARRGGAGG